MSNMTLKSRIILVFYITVVIVSYNQTLHYLSFWLWWYRGLLNMFILSWLPQLIFSLRCKCISRLSKFTHYSGLFRSLPSLSTHPSPSLSLSLSLSPSFSPSLLLLCKYYNSILIQLECSSIFYATQLKSMRILENTNRNEWGITGSLHFDVSKYKPHPSKKIDIRWRMCGILVIHLSWLWTLFW